MKKIKLLFILLIFILVPLNVTADINSSTNGTGEGCSGTDSCWRSVGTINGISKSLYSVRVTVFNEKAERVSNSIDITINKVPNDYGVKRNNTITSKIEYLNGSTLNWNDGTLNDLIVLSNDIATKFAKDSNVFDDDSQDTFQKVIADYFHENGFSSIANIKEKLQFCGENYISKCSDNYKYYAVFEPTTAVVAGTTKYYGTSYELAEKVWGYKHISSVIRRELPNALYIVGESPKFYKKAEISSKNGEYNIHKTSGNYSQNEVLNFGVGISVFEWKHDEDKIITRKDKTCSVNVNINECGESSIYEANSDNVNNNKECIVDNAAYSYISGCNLYCSDEITTDFNGFYGTFIGNNALNAIRSGKYLAIKSNPKITIKKTCYQSSTSNECSDVTGSFKNQLNSDYKTNKIYLNIDGKKYEFVGQSSISNNGYSSATITYEYKLDDNINKYIDIETMKGILNPSNNNKVITNEGPMIITSKGYYGVYTYNFDVSETVLNKYASSSKYLTNLKNSQSTKYNFNNTISIGYTKTDNTTTDTYTTTNLKDTTCSYVKYNTDTSCICKENSCCDSVTCEEVDCPQDENGNKCTCTGKYGCYDDGKCTPIDPDLEKDKSDLCDPEEKTCFPNVIYRPISLIEPFPGIDGNGRTPGNNWNKIYKASNGKVYSYSDYYVRLRRGYKNYEIYQAEPLYVIKLDGDKIQAIRKYNDKHNYNDFELTCINGENCISKFLRGQTQDFSINLIDSGTCKNINNYNFNSCIKNKGE